MLRDPELDRHAVGQSRYVRDYPERSSRGPKLLECGGHRVECLRIKAAEPFVEEHRFESRSAGRREVCHLIRQSQSQRKRREEGLPAGKRPDRAALVGVGVVDDLETKLRVVGERVRSARELPEPPARTRDELLERAGEPPALEGARSKEG